ncbi:MAG: 7-cyano-7-deazaguanine synthase QueC [Candidatus Heimdallarchaeaceae archaeon]|jgi:7-cyano-7-deazaguanine synthase
MPKKEIERTAIILFSGGIDSTACLYWAKDRYNKISLISFIYGSKEDIVIERLNKVFSELLSLDSKIIDLPFLEEFTRISGSKLSLAEDDPPEFEEYKQLDEKLLVEETAKQVWIPGRNVMFLSIVASFADSLNQPVDILFGANKEEGETFPDNTIEFVEIMNSAFTLGCKNHVEIQAPFHDKIKHEIVSYLKEKGAPLDLTSSCYNIKNWDKNKEKPIHCGKCESCFRRKRAFSKAKIDDLTLYK